VGPRRRRRTDLPDFGDTFRSMPRTDPASQTHDMNLLFQQGVALHQQGQLAAAKAIYEQVLGQQPRHFDALHLLGVLAYQTRHPDAAARLIGQAIAINPNVAAAYSNRGLALQDLGAVDDALAGFDKAIALQPDYADAHSNRGNALLALERPDDALASYDRAIALRPDFADAHSNRGNALCALGRFDEALAAYDLAIASQPRHAQAHANRGNALKALGRVDDALASYERALQIQPDDADALSGRGSALKELRRLDESLACFDRALALKPGHADAWSNRGNALQEMGRHAEALASYDGALAARPDYVEAWSNRGMALQELGRTDDAIASFDEAIRLEPERADARWNKALTLLSAGRLQPGWALHEWRWKRREAARSVRHFAQPLWLGEENLCGRTILLHAEQGLGDTLQFCRYAKLVRNLGATVLFEAPKALLPVLAGLDGVDGWVEQGGPLPAFDVQCPLMSLPLAFGTGPGTIPSPGAYLVSRADKREAWTGRLGERTGLRVGLVWSGSRTHQNDRKRSLPLDRLMAPLPRGPQYVSLQKDVRDEDLAALAAAGVRHFGDELRDFADTAALCDLMDLVVSVDTSVAHLAGALGKRTWVLLPFLPDWRWMLKGERSPWYRSMKLYRQGEDRRWEPVLDRVARDLASGPAQLDEAVRV
jgi:tetratricopeptide (TPR) repeat protein